MKENEYRCECCERVYACEAGWTDKDAESEFKINFPEHDGSPKSIICDNCYIKMKSWRDQK